MKLFKKIFKKKKSVEEVKQEQQDKYEEILHPEPDYSHLPKCNHCGNYVHPHQPRKNENAGYNKKNAYHVKCYRRSLKNAKQMAMSSEVGNLLRSAGGKA